MGKRNITDIFKIVKTAASKHSPEILTGIGIAGMITTTILAVKATPKALRLIEMETARINRELVREAADNGYENCEQISELKPIDVVKVAWKCYIPAAITGVTSISCLIGASSVHLKRNAVLASAYKLSETALTEYKDAVLETVGEEKMAEVKDKVAEERLKKEPASKSDILVIDSGNVLCFDHHAGRYFESSREKLKKAENSLNKLMLTENYASLNDFYDYVSAASNINLQHTVLGDDLGWSVDNKQVELYFSSQIADDGRPCLVIDYEPAPKYDYSSYR